MKVGEFLVDLQTLLAEGLIDHDTEIIMQKDSEGNGYTPLAGIDGDAIYVPDSTWSGKVYATTWTADDNLMEEDEWATLLQQPRCLVFYPVN